MSLVSLRYTEFKGDSRHWELKECDFQDFNLVVGRNATGKTRLMTVINALMRIFTGRQTDAYDSGTYDAVVHLAGKKYRFQIEFADCKVVRELLTVDGKKNLIRNEDGTGRIFYEGVQDFISFKVDEKSIAFQQRVDELQHPFVAALAKWALGANAFSFNSSFLHNVVSPLNSWNAKPHRNSGGVEMDLVRTYADGFDRFGDTFDAAIKRDMKKLGYRLTDVGAGDISLLGLKHSGAETMVGLFATEHGRDLKIASSRMSQGMFRALGLIICINVASLGGDHTLVLVDDIGEGLDYERSVELIDVLRLHAKNSEIQLIMTTNDRFVMNRVPLENWVILRRKNATVRAYTERNSKEKFDQFRFMGLSNFDLFSSSVFQ